MPLCHICVRDRHVVLLVQLPLGNGVELDHAFHRLRVGLRVFDFALQPPPRTAHVESYRVNLVHARVHLTARSGDALEARAAEAGVVRVDALEDLGAVLVNKALGEALLEAPGEHAAGVAVRLRREAKHELGCREKRQKKSGELVLNYGAVE